MGLLTGGLGVGLRPGSLLTAGLGTPAPPPPVTGLPPDPRETVWTLGSGGATWLGTLTQGFALNLAGRLRNNGLPSSYASTTALDAAVWPGGQGPVVIVPSVAWDTANGGAPAGRLMLTIPANAAVALDPATYRLQVGLTVAGTRYLAWDSEVRLLDGPGGTTFGPVLCSMADLALYASSPPKATAGSAGFLAERVRATAEFLRNLVIRYSPEQGYTRVRQNTVDPIVGQDVPTQIPPVSKAAVAAALAGKPLGAGLIQEPASREIVARLTLAMIDGRQFNSREYMMEAKIHKDTADALFASYAAQIDLDGDGVPDIEISRNCTYLPAGTAP